MEAPKELIISLTARSEFLPAGAKMDRREVCIPVTGKSTYLIAIGSTEAKCANRGEGTLKDG